MIRSTVLKFVSLVIFTVMGLSASFAATDSDALVANFINRDGRKIRLSSDDNRLNAPVTIPGVRFKSNKRMCRATTSENLNSYQSEMDLELTTLIQNYARFEKLTKNHKHLLAKIPDCQLFRHKLYILSELTRGGKFLSFD